MATCPASRPEPSAGTYVRLRREHAGLSQREVAMLYAASSANALAAELLLAEIEADRHIASEDAIARLRAAFPLDRYIYRQLVEGLPAPAICRACGCSWADPCDDEVLGPCGWTSDPTLCTHCAGPAPASDTTPPQPRSMP